MRPTAARKKQKFSGWFRPCAPSKRSGSLLFCGVEIQNNKIKEDAIIISIPKSCGNAVLRNRFRRMIKGFLKRKLQHASPPWSQDKGIWIRLTKGFVIPKRVVLADWKADLEKILLSFGLSSLLFIACYSHLSL